MHTETVNLPTGEFFSIYVEEITVYEHPRTMIYFDGPCDLRVIRDGEPLIVTGRTQTARNFGVKAPESWRQRT